MKTFSFLNKTFVVLLCSVLAFVCVARPLQARADSASMDYVETDMSTSDVKSLFTGASAIVPAAIMIIGFIVMCYCVLRNVEVPLQFDSQTSFNDKLSQLGQYAIDNATDDIKNFLYSVYTYCDDNGITSVLGLSKFVALQAAKFFGAITNWIGGSLLNNPTEVGEGLINSFLDTSYLTLPSINSAVSSVFNSYSSVNFASTLSFSYYFTQSSKNHYRCFGLTRLLGVNYSEYIGVLSNNGFYMCKLLNGVLTVINTPVFSVYNEWDYAVSSSLNPAPNLSSYSDITFGNYSISINYQLQRASVTPSYFYITSGDRFLLNTDLYAFVSSLGLSSILQFDGITGDESSFSLGDLKGISLDILNPAVDNVYVPTDVWNIDIVGTWEQIARDVSATYDQTERIAAFVGDIPLTLTSAQSYSPTINDAGNYVFPDFGSVWKYPQYFFDTLSGWGMFVGNCLRAVTVDEGGLSWIFYGGFVLLVCGGIIGKILMG